MAPPSSMVTALGGNQMIAQCERLRTARPLPDCSLDRQVRETYFALTVPKLTKQPAAM
jgi:hypothetical protein